MTEREIQVYSYTLNIQSIKMKVKFPCKMKLQFQGESLTPQVSQNEAGKFIFNQEVTLREDTDRTHFEIVANLATDKGAKYIAGVIRLAQSQLVQQQGQMLVVHLSKCLDSDASCELRVDQVSSEKIMKKVTADRGGLPVRSKQSFQDYTSPKRNVLSPGFEPQNNFGGTKSQYQFPMTFTNKPAGILKSRQQGNLSIFDKPRSRSPNNFRKTNVAATYIQRNLPQFGMLDTNNRDKLIQAEVYKQSYQKLKQKYKKEAENAKHQLNKRMALENNENNFKLQIMRLKLRCEQQQKTITDKNLKLKQMQIQLAALQKKQLDLNYLREQSTNKQHTIRMLEDTIRALNRDNQDLKTLNRERFESQQQKIRQLRSEVDGNRQKYQFKFIQLQRQLKLKLDIISQKETELKIRDERIQRQQRLVDQLQKSAQTKTFQYQRALQTQQNQWRTKSQEFRNAIDKLEKQKSRLQQQLQNSKSQQQKIKSYIIKIEYDKKILTQQTDGFKSELNELKIMKQKHQQLLRDHRLLTQDKNHLQRQFQKSIQTKDSNLSQLAKQHQQQIQHYRRIYKQIQQKFRNSQNKIIEIQSSLEQRKGENEKMRKNIDALTKQSNDLKQRQKSLKKSLKSKEQQFSQLTAQLESNRYKSKSGDQLTRYQLQALRQELVKHKRDLDSEMLKSTQLTQKVSNLTNQLSKNRLQIQHMMDQAEKQGNNYKQKISSLQSYNKQYEKRVDELNNLISNLRSSDKENQLKIQKFELEALKTNQKIQKLQKQIRIHQQKGQQYENQLKNKQNQLGNNQNVRQNLERKINQYEEKLTNTKNSLNTVTGQKNKNDKIIQLLQKQIGDLKQDTERLNKSIQSHENQQQNLRGELKKSKQQFLKLQMKNSTLKKQYERFKQHLHQTLSTTFSQIPLPGSNNDLRISNTSGENLQTSKRNANNDSDTSIHHGEILQRVTSQNKDIKTAMAKLIQQNKILQKQVQRLSDEGLNNNARNQLTETALTKRIQQLQDDLNKTYNEKEDQNAKNRAIIQQLQVQLQQRQNAYKELMLQIEQLNFTINSLKMDQQASSEHYTLKQNQYKSKISQLQEKINYLTLTLNDSQSKCQDLQGKLNFKLSELDTEKDNGSKKDKQIKILNQQKKNYINQLQQSKRQRKQLLQKISQLQLKLSTQIQLKQKGKFLLEDEQRKGTQLKQFVANLMKQKQLAIKGDLEKSELIINLEAQIIEANREKQMKDQQIQRLRKNVEQSKETIKKLNNQLKDSQAFGGDQKGRNAKLNQRLREKERELKQYQQLHNKLKIQFQSFTTKSNKTINDLQSELAQKIKKKDNEISDITDRLHEAEKQWQQAQSKAVTYKSEIVILEQNLFMEKQAGEVKTEQSNKLLQQLEQIKAQLKSFEETINTLNQEVRQKQQNIYQFTSKIYNLETKVEAKQDEKNEKINALIEDASSKYDNMVDEYQQRIQLVEKQKNYFKSRLQQKQQEYRKVVAQLRNSQIEDAGLKKALQQKVKRLQDQRLTLISSKNAQIQRLAEDNKSKFEILKSKEADLRKLQHELQVARSTISKFQQSKRETQQKIRQINKAYQNQLQQLKKKQANARTSALQLQRIQWDVQRQVKKTIQIFSKKLVTVDQKQQNQRILSTIKGLQEEVVNTIQHKLSGNSPRN